MKDHKHIQQCHESRMSHGGRVYTAMLENAIAGWTAELVETTNHDAAMQLRGAIRNVRYLLRRIEETPIKK